MSDRSTPKIPTWLFNRFIRLYDRGYFLDDITEAYHEYRHMKGKLYSDAWFWFQFFKSLPSFISYSCTGGYGMIKNYLKIALRNLLRYRGYSFINISGLAVGIACCFLILLYVQDELSYDKFHENSHRIYRVTRQWFNSDGASNLHLGHVAPPFKELLVTDFGEIEAAVRIRDVGSILIGNGTLFFPENRLVFAEQSFFDVFSFPLLKGNPETALTDPMTVVITKSIALKYFGDEDPVNKNLQFDYFGQKGDLRVTGVIADMPENSHFHFDMIDSFKTYEMFATDLRNFGSNNYATYLLLPEKYDISKMSSAMPAFIDKHMGPGMHERTILHFQKLTDIHLHSHLDSEIEANSDIKYIYIFSAIAVFVLLIACINFMNLSTARSAGRSREVGLRKTIGAERLQLVRQFLGETMLLAFAGMLAAIVIVLLVLSTFREFTGKTLAFTLNESMLLLGGLAGITILVGIIAGSYPAFYLSSFKPARVLRGTSESGTKGSFLRTVLVVFQFAVSIVLIISMGVVGNQLDYVRNASLGFDKEQIVVISGTPQMQEQYDSIRDRLMQQQGIINVACSKRVPSGRLLDSSGARVISGNTQQPVEFRIAVDRVSHDFLSTYKIGLAAGRDFSREYTTDTLRAFILNETAVRELGWTPEEAVGKDFMYGRVQGNIIGVMKDFHFESMHHPISPLIFYIGTGNMNALSIRIAPGRIKGAMQYIQELYKEYRPYHPFDYYFIDERFDQQYRAEEKLGQIFGYFSFLAVIIACLGLFGLVSYTAERRTKEIGIRKVLGASVSSIVRLLTVEFLRLVLISNIIAWPLAYYAMDRWLQAFAYRIDIGLLSFVASAVIALVIALATVSWQAIKAALTDPVKAIKYE